MGDLIHPDEGSDEIPASFETANVEDDNINLTGLKRPLEPPVHLGCGCSFNSQDAPPMHQAGSMQYSQQGAARAQGGPPPHGGMPPMSSSTASSRAAGMMGSAPQGSMPYPPWQPPMPPGGMPRPGQQQYHHGWHPGMQHPMAPHPAMSSHGGQMPPGMGQPLPGMGQRMMSYPGGQVPGMPMGMPMGSAAGQPLTHAGFASQLRQYQHQLERAKGMEGGGQSTVDSSMQQWLMQVQQYVQSLVPEQSQRWVPEPGDVELLERVFELEKWPGRELRHQLAERLHVRPRQVQVWFQNKRQRTKSSQPEDDSQNPPTPDAARKSSAIIDELLRAPVAFGRAGGSVDPAASAGVAQAIAASCLAPHRPPLAGDAALSVAATATFDAAAAEASTATGVKEPLAAVEPLPLVEAPGDDSAVVATAVAVEATAEAVAEPMPEVVVEAVAAVAEAVAEPTPEVAAVAAAEVVAEAVAEAVAQPADADASAEPVSVVALPVDDVEDGANA